MSDRKGIPGVEEEFALLGAVIEVTFGSFLFRGTFINIYVEADKNELFCPCTLANVNLLSCYNHTHSYSTSTLYDAA